MFYICKKLFSILSVSICIICYIPIYSDNKVSLFVGDKHFKEWFNDKKNNKELKPIFENNNSLYEFVIQDDKKDINIPEDTGLGYQTYSYNKLDIEKIKSLSNINGDNFIILLDNVSYLDDEKDDSSIKGLIAILLQNNGYKIIEINEYDDRNLNFIIDKSEFRLRRSKYFSVYKIDLNGLDFRMDEIKPVVQPVIHTEVQPVVQVIKPEIVKPVQPVIHTEVHQVKPVVPVKPVAVKPAVQPVPQVIQPVPQIEQPVIHTEVQPEVHPVVPVIQPVQPVVQPVGLKKKDIVPGNSNDNNLCSCKSEIKITS